MENSLVVAKTLYNMYNQKFQSDMDEMKMHKLMYFAQRESLMYNKEVMFEEDFYGWKFGPVLKSVRQEYATGSAFADVSGTVSPDTQKLLHDVLERYGSLSSWKLSCLSHGEFSWRRSREGLAASDNGDVALRVNAMMIDAVHELAERKMQMRA